MAVVDPSAWPEQQAGSTEPVRLALGFVLCRGLPAPSFLEVAGFREKPAKSRKQSLGSDQGLSGFEIQNYRTRFAGLPAGHSPWAQFEALEEVAGGSRLQCVSDSR
jgi:hypothetical protein